MVDSVAQTDSSLPYSRWAEEALRAVVIEALEHVAQHGLPGEHHFYLTFRTDYPGVDMPGHLRARYREEMTIVLQHRFWDLKVDRAERLFSVGLSFGNVPATLRIPFAALIAFADPHVRFGLRFQLAQEAAAQPAPEAEAAPPEEAAPAAPATVSQVVSLDAFRRRRD